MLHRRHRKPRSRGVPRAGRFEKLQAVEMRIGRRAHQLPHDAAGRGVRKIDVDGITVALGEEHHVTPVRAQRRSEVVTPRFAMPSGDEGGRRDFAFRVGSGCLHRRAQRLVPVARQRGGVDASGGDQPADGAAARLRGHCPRGQIVTEAAAQIRPQRLPVPIGKPARVVELFEGRQPISLHGVAQPHRRIRVHPPDREVLGHPLGEPERQQRHGRALPTQHVALEGVHELVAEDVVRFAERRGERQHDAAALVIGEAADAFWDVAGHDGRLSEMRVAGVQHDRRTLGERVPEDSREARIPAFRHARRDGRRLGFVRVIVDVEVRGRQDLESEAVVLDLVRSKVLGRRRRRQRARQRKRQRHRFDDRSHHGKS